MKKIIIQVIVLTMTLWFTGCKKDDVSLNPNQLAEKQIIEKYTIVPKGLNPILQRVADKIKQDNDKTHFLDKLGRRSGVPIWNACKITVKSRSNAAAREESDNWTEVIIPISLPNSQKVDGFMVCFVNENNVDIIRTYEDQFYENYGFGKPDGEVDAEEIAKMSMELESDAFEHNKFQITDNRLFKPFDPNVVLTKPTQIIVINSPQTAQKVIIIKHSHCTGHTGTGSGGHEGGDCDECWDCVDYEYLCVNNSWDAGGNNTGSGSSSGGSSGGSSGSTGWSSIPPDDTPNANPEHQKVDLQKMMNCFTQIPDAGATYEIKLSIDIPVNGHPETLINWSNGGDVGHSFITLTKTGISGVKYSQSFGFYPQNGIKNILSLGTQPCPSYIVNNGNGGHEHEANATLTMPNVSSAQFQTAIATSLATCTNQYNITNYNCTSFTLGVINSTLPSASQIVSQPMTYNLHTTYGPQAVQFTDSPAGLYQTLQNMQNAGNANISTNILTTATTSHGECN